MSERYKLLPCSIWNIGVIETWLSEMAAKGLFIENFGRYFTKFIKGEPAVTHYRIDVIPTENDEELEKKINIYKDCGWKYVNTYMNFHIFSSPHEFNSNEVYNITEEQAALLTPLYKSKIKDILICFILLFGMIILPKFFMKDNLNNYLLELNILDIFSYLIGLVLILYILYELILLRKIIKSLKEGIPIKHHCKWKLRVVSSVIFKASFTVIILLIFFAPGNRYIGSGYTILDENIDTLPVVTLQDISEVKSKTSSTEFKVQPAAWAGTQRTLFMPVKYETSQYYRKFIKPNEWKTLDLKSNSYKLRLHSMVNDYLDTLIKNQNEIASLLQLSIEPEKYKSFDVLKVYKSQDTYFIYASKNNGILTVSYLYDDDIDSVIKAMEQKMDLLLNSESKL